MSKVHAEWDNEGTYEFDIPDGHYYYVVFNVTNTSCKGYFYLNSLSYSIEGGSSISTFSNNGIYKLTFKNDKYYMINVYTQNNHTTMNISTKDGHHVNFLVYDENGTLVYPSQNPPTTTTTNPQNDDSSSSTKTPIPLGAIILTLIAIPLIILRKKVK
ncbi:hypothetical protein Metig_0812 [Methanotorris igneus Kol 5]|uniref:Uncharacterized protein n=1 Tax=Methanotorris igneus (strain DSM 5666 / JCM 11834 / Kol 5) TaxID=880724 RepID=F6BCZ6_METIK|nr:hypothetical protein Metig_0812 [Methanotorris igneus Kol 5]